MSFSALGLSEAFIKRLPFSQPTVVQSQVIPQLLQGQNLLVSAPTGTGKTAAFVLPILEKLSIQATQLNQASQISKVPQVLVMAPTRELVMQIVAMFEQCLTHHEAMQSLKVHGVYGGTNANQSKKILAAGVEIVVATPGRLFDLLAHQALVLTDIEYLVIDEADRMLDMGFVNDMKRLHKLLPSHHQSLLFSATYTDEIAQFAQAMFATGQTIVVDREQAAPNIEQLAYLLHPQRKAEYVAELIGKQNLAQVLIFATNKQQAEIFYQELKLDGIACDLFYADKTQARRNQALEDFKSGKIRALVATDLAARGLDIQGLPLVINIELPENAQDYLHRIGRTGRAGAFGQAITLLAPSEKHLFMKMLEEVNASASFSILAGYEPTTPLPDRYQLQHKTSKQLKTAFKGKKKPFKAAKPKEKKPFYKRDKS